MGIPYLSPTIRITPNVTLHTTSVAPLISRTPFTVCFALLLLLLLAVIIVGEEDDDDDDDAAAADDDDDDETNITLGLSRPS